MSSTVSLHPSKTDSILLAVNAAVAAIPPAWPLSATVAVNPGSKIVARVLADW